MPDFNNAQRYVQWILCTVGDCRWAQTKNGHWHMVGSMGAVDGEPLIQRCDITAPMMAKAFPELRVVYGYYRSDRTRGQWIYHVWCTDKDGLIIDPTGRQFDAFDGPAGGYQNGEYERYVGFTPVVQR